MDDAQQPAQGGGPGGAAAGLDGERVVADASQPPNKKALRDATDAAIAIGVFGVPMLLVDGELFWGYDDFPWIERVLAGDDPIDTAMVEEWSGGIPRRGAWRRQAPPSNR